MGPKFSWRTTMTRILIAINESPSATKAVEYVAQRFGQTQDMQISLVHVLPNLPAIFWDEGHILSEDEKRERKKVVDKWLVSQKAKMEPLFTNAVGLLTAKGFRPANIETKFISDSTDTADSILEEARDGNYQTVVVGRSHHSPKHVLGAVAGRIASQGSGMVVAIVG
jgi:nucleotide-binding universal stress UspA family protein